MIKSPFTPEQVKKLNEYQEGGWMHPFTCGGCSNRDGLIATEAGWICPDCDYTQDWAHEFMLEPNPLGNFLKK